MQPLNPEMILNAYALGLFPMADSADAGEIYWYDPEMRGQMPIATLHVPRRLRKTLRRAPYKVTFNRDFETVIDQCAAVRQETWINRQIRDVFIALHQAGFAHSIEAWRGGECVGGLYGLALGGAFFGESMFSTATDASKICLVHLAAHLKKQGFEVFDTQFINDHIKQFGVYEIPRKEYLEKLEEVIFRLVSFVPYSAGSADSSSSAAVSFDSDSDSVTLFLQSITQTS